MAFFNSKAAQTEQAESEQRGGAFEQFIAEGDAAIDECNNEAAARRANQQGGNS